MEREIGRDDNILVPGGISNRANKDAFSGAKLIRVIKLFHFVRGQRIFFKGMEYHVPLIFTGLHKCQKSV